MENLYISTMKRKRIPKVLPFGGIDEYFLQSGPDGILRVKDGRTLEEYLNDPRLVKRRKKAGASEMILIQRAYFERISIPHCA